jgi:hypothetical protein
MDNKQKIDETLLTIKREETCITYENHNVKIQAEINI